MAPSKRLPCLSIVSLAALLLVSAVAASPVRGAILSIERPSSVDTGPDGLPSCAYADIATAHSSYGDWATTLLDPTYALPSDYAPTDLVSVGAAGVAGSGQVRALVVDDLRAMAADAERAGAPVAVLSAYRSYDDQVRTFNGWVEHDGYEQALTASARPGHSEHQLGTAIDFQTLGGGAPWSVTDWATTASGSWLAQNAWRYGFVMSYPKDKTAITCYEYEPWHYRYVGRSLAAQIHDSGTTTREFLWSLTVAA